MSREEVADSQRTRMLYGMADAVAEKGYANVSVADVLKRAGVSRETFYAQFAKKEDCLLAAYEATVAVIREDLREVVPAAPGEADAPVDRFRRFVDCYLDGLAGEPTLAWTFLIEIHSAGPEAVKRRVEAWSQGIDAISQLVGAETERQRFTCAALFTALIGLVTQRVGAGEIGKLGEVRDPLLEFARSALEAVDLGKSAERS